MLEEHGCKHPTRCRTAPHKPWEISVPIFTSGLPPYASPLCVQANPTDSGDFLSPVTSPQPGHPEKSSWWNCLLSRVPNWVILILWSPKSYNSGHGTVPRQLANATFNLPVLFFIFAQSFVISGYLQFPAHSNYISSHVENLDVMTWAGTQWLTRIITQSLDLENQDNLCWIADIYSCLEQGARVHDIW